MEPNLFIRLPKLNRLHKKATIKNIIVEMLRVNIQ